MTLSAIGLLAQNPHCWVSRLRVLLTTTPPVPVEMTAEFFVVPNGSQFAGEPG